jgi:hypothetical protein
MSTPRDASASAVRVLIASEPRSYREFLAAALARLRPHAEVTALAPEGLDGALTRLRPHLVVCSRLTERVLESALCWVLLYPDGESRVEVGIAGEGSTAADLRLDELLALVDRTQRLLRAG